MNKHHPDIAVLRKELADLWRTARRLRAERRTQPTIAKAWSEGWRVAEGELEGAWEKQNK